MSRGRQIGRMKLKPLSPEIREKYLLDWDALELRRAPARFAQLTSAELFGNAAPLEVEIGAGSGEYLCHLAVKDPQTNFLGIEVSRRAAQLSVNLAAELELTNVRILRADFKLLTPLLEPRSWEAVYLHFPDPQHKRRDAKRALFDQSFLDAMAGALVSGGRLSVVSDKAEFLASMLRQADGDVRFARAQARPGLEEFEPDVKSRFQLSWERKGLKPYRFILQRV